MTQMELTGGIPGAAQATALERRNRFSVAGPDASERAALEARVRSGFGAHFGACVAGFMPAFAWYRHASGATGVIGFRRASEEPLYLENYLERPIDETLGDLVGRRVERHRIAEVGQFVIDDRDIVGRFFRDLVPFLCANEFDWVCFTGTLRIRAILDRIGFRGLPVAAASADLVRHSGDDWGSYYDHDPVVMLGKLDDPQGAWCRHLSGQAAPRAGGA